MMRTLTLWGLAGVCALLLAACASTAGGAALQAQAVAPVRIEAVGTLATNACEAAVAADYTALIVSRRRAAQLVRSGAMPLTGAFDLQSQADRARAALDAACPGGKPDAPALATARAALAQVRKTLEAYP